MDSVEKILLDKHVRPTAMRMLIYKFMAEKKTPLKSLIAQRYTEPLKLFLKIQLCIR